jgi:hypothetical protein
VRSINQLLEEVLKANMSTTTNTTKSSPKKTTQGSQAPSPKKVAKKSVPAEGEPEKAPRKASLKEKHSRFLVSNYSLIQFLSSQGLLSDEAVDTAYAGIKLFAPVDEQEAFYESFLTESKNTKKTLNKFVKERMKPPKAAKERKTRAKKAEGETAPKKSRAKKTTNVANDTNVDVVAQTTSADNGASDLVNELTAAANAVAAPSTPENQTTNNADAPGAPQKERKPRAKKETAEKKPKAEKKETTAEKKPKADKKETAAEKKPKADKKSKKETPVEVYADAPVVLEDGEVEEEIHTQEIEINGKSYLIDSDNNIYSVDTHEEIGTYDAETKSIVAA